MNKGDNISSKNPYLDFYGRYAISPVNQDITDLNLHFRRREKLYRLLGLPPVVFMKRTVLEVGPGGGYNSLALFAWGASLVFVEPNPTARQQIKGLLSSYGIDRRRYRIYSESVEDLSKIGSYPVVIAEGFIPGLYERRQVIDSLSSLVMPGGAIVVTCVDDMSYLMELVKRIVAHHLLKSLGVDDFSGRVRVLSQAFSSHLATLKHASRPVEDWVADMFLNPAGYGNFFSMADCVEEFGDQFDLLGSSPSMFTNYSWYKDIHYNERESYIGQFHGKHHMLISTSTTESPRGERENKHLERQAYKLRMASRVFENGGGGKELKRIVSILETIAGEMRGMDRNIANAMQEGIALLTAGDISINRVAKARVMASAFGRGQQYVSLVRRMNTNPLKD